MKNFKLLTLGQLEGIPAQLTELKLMRIHHHKKMVTTHEDFIDDVLDEIYDDLIVSDQLKDSTLLTEQERLWILMVQVINSKGKDFEIEGRCGGDVTFEVKSGKGKAGIGCGHKYTIPIDLTKLPVNSLKEGYADSQHKLLDGTGTFTLSIPRRATLKANTDIMRERWAELKENWLAKTFPEHQKNILKGKEEEAWEEFVKLDGSHLKQKEYDEAMLAMVSCISKVNGKGIDAQERYDFLMKDMTQADIEICNKFNETWADFGLKLEYNTTCPKCKGGRVISVPFRPEFFFPAVASDRAYKKSTVVK